MSHQSTFGLRMPSSTVTSVPHANWWNNVLSICLQGCVALVLGAVFCLIVACASPASWSGPKDFVQGCYRLFATTDMAEPANIKQNAPKPLRRANDGQNDNAQTVGNFQQDDSKKRTWSNELEARAAMESLLEVPFPKVRPPWLLNPTTNRCLELDLYAESLKLAVEVDGRQHAEWPNAFHATREMFEQQQLRDALKDTLCKLQGVKLIRVPHTVKRGGIKLYLRQALSDAGVPIKES